MCVFEFQIKIEASPFDDRAQRAPRQADLQMSRSMRVQTCLGPCPRIIGLMLPSIDGAAEAQLKLAPLPSSSGRSEKWSAAWATPLSIQVYIYMGVCMYMCI